MEYAVTEISGKQIPVSLGKTIVVDKIEGEKGKKLFFDKVLLYRFDGQILIGQPYLADMIIEAEIVEQIKGEKIDVIKFKNKVRYRRKMGFRPLWTRILITKVGKLEKVTEPKKTKPKTTTKKIKKATRTIKK